MLDNRLMNEESVVCALKKLYGSYGYSKFKMSRFEEYDLYAHNKNFLVSDNVITFTDTNGKLLALKPDVTLSIVKNTTPEAEGVKKLYYSENVYRVAAKTHEFKEIMQVGLECIGNVDVYATAEVITLAAKSLELIDPDYILDLSHMSFATELLSEISADARKRVIGYMSEKNVHMIKAEALCDEITEKLISLVGIYAEPETAIARLTDLEISNEAVTELRKLVSALVPSGVAEHIRFDFSVAGDGGYYNGITFAGYVHGVPVKVLSGGRYDNLMKRFDKDCGAIGFAVYMDALEQLLCDKTFNEVDTLILYDSETDIVALSGVVEKLVVEGKRVNCARSVPKGLKYNSVIDMGGKA